MNARSITFLPTKNLKATDRFYQGMLGLQLALDQGVCRIYSVGIDGAWGFCEHVPLLDDPSKVTLTMVVPDVNEWHVRLTVEGATVDGPPRINQRFGIQHFYTTDPNGYRLEIQKFL
ncbi:VOC domain containing protein [Fimbriimonadaceae bacterium]|jgi:catechol 2,3-dioxygenase-like lactoylglutathione lyase family enzyme